MIILSLTAVAWMAATLLLAWLPPRRLRLPLMVLSTVGFLAFKEPLSLAVMAAQTALTLWALPRVGRQGWLTLAMVSLELAALVAFKIRVDLIPGGNPAMPLGLSFTTFRQVHLLVDAYSGRLPVHGRAETLAYLFFLPPLAVGPIHRFQTFLRDLRRRRFEAAQLGQGLERILHGYAKLIILRNLVIFPFLFPWVSTFGDGSFTGDVMTSLGQWIDLYITFSGCSDVAIGFALSMGFRIQENFERPFLARSLPDFWQRWHMSLTSWCRDYVFAPLTASTRKPYLGVAAALVVLGLWHELSVRYVLWGFYHALGILLWHQLVPRLKAALPQGRWRAWTLRPLATAATLVFVVSSFAVTRRADLLLKSALRHLL